MVETKSKEDSQATLAAQAAGATDWWGKLNLLAGEPDLLELFGDSGSCKSKFLVALGLGLSTQGKRVLFFDAEGNLAAVEKAALSAAPGVHIEVVETLESVIRKVESLIPDSRAKAKPTHYDAVFLDSVGFNPLVDFATSNMKERGQALMEVIAALGTLKRWARTTGGIAVATNQPQSWMGVNKDSGEVRHPFGDKGEFVPKEILFSTKTQRGLNGNPTKSLIAVFRSRDKPEGLEVAEVSVRGPPGKPATEVSWRI